MPEGFIFCLAVSALCHSICAVDFCKRFDRLCSQKCVNTDDSYVCQCEPGYRLLEDRITCIEDSKDANNSVTDDFE